MKRSVKSVLSLCLAALLCLTLCSCGTLDRLRASRAVMNDDGSIELQDQRYSKLDDSAERALASLTLGSYENYAYLVEPDVPDLLVEFFGATISHNDSGTLLLYNGDYYVRDDYRDTLLGLIENPVYDSYCCWTYSEKSADYRYLLIDSRWNSLLDTLAGLAAQAAKEGFDPIDGEDSLEFYWSDTLYSCDSNMICYGAPFEILEASDMDTGETAGYYVVDESTDMAIAVPQENTAELESFIEAFGLF